VPSSSAQADLGMALLSAKRLEEALVAFSRARDLDPGCAQAHCGLGLVYQQLGRWWEAADAFRRAEHLAPENPAGPTNLGAVLHILGEHEQARAALRRASSLAPDDEELRRALEQEAVPATAQDEVTRPMAPPAELSASMAGNLNTFPLLDVLEFLHTQNKSGVLTVSAGAGAGAGVVRLIGGKVVSATTPGAKRLGETLLEQRLVKPKELDAAIAATGDARDDLLGTELVRRGNVGQAQLGAVVWREILRSLEEILDWREGAFAFRDSNAEPAPPLSFTLPQIKLSLSKRKDARVRSQA
jgi:tetratricopeptide (TPR) repeat protein